VYRVVGPDAYFMGIIDFQQKWTITKRVSCPPVPTVQRYFLCLMFPKAMSDEEVTLCDALNLLHVCNFQAFLVVTCSWSASSS
jgi:hypothetical protein